MILVMIVATKMIMRCTLHSRLADQCMLGQDPPPTDYEVMLGQKPGQRYAPNTQCVIMFGLGAYYCGVSCTMSLLLCGELYYELTIVW